MLEQFVLDEVRYNDQLIGLSGYREMLERDFAAIPDLYFDIQLLISDPPRIASRRSPALRTSCDQPDENDGEVPRWLTGIFFTAPTNRTTA